MKNNKIIIFDFDGVFVDDFDFHKNHIADFLGIDIDDKAFYNIHSGNVYKDDNVGLELGNFDVQKYCQKIHDDLINLPIVEGMSTAVGQAQKIGKSFVVSSGCEKNIRDFFENNDICTNVCSIYGVETNLSKEKKLEKILQDSNIEAQNAIFITDTLGDIREANKMRVASIAVTWGFQRVETLEQGAPFGFAHTPMQIIDLIQSYFLLD